jgi:hypothetical protein
MKITRNITNLEQDLILDGQVFEGVQNFRHIYTMTHSKNVISEEIKSRTAAGNRSCYSLGQIFGSGAMSKAVKIKIYYIMVKPVVVCGSETWPMAEVDMKRLKTWDRKILRRIYRSVVEQGIWRTRTDH